MADTTVTSTPEPGLQRAPTKKEQREAKKAGKSGSKNDKLSMTELADKYQVAAAVIDSDPELRALFMRAMNGEGDTAGTQWTAAMFTTQLKATKWYQEHSNTWRTTEETRLVDPKTYKREYDQVVANVKSAAASLGVQLTGTTIQQLAMGAYRGGYSSDQINQSIQQTSAFTGRPEAVRKADVERVNDPETYKANVAGMKADVLNAAAALGAKLTDAQAAEWAQKFYNWGWDPQEQRFTQRLAEYITPGEDGTLSGSAGSMENKLRALANANGITKDDGYFQSAARSIAAGLSTEDDYNEEIRKTAASLYLPYSQQILSGEHTVEDLASSYTNLMAQTLELDPKSIKLTDPFIQKALTGTDASTGDPQAQTLWDFKKTLRGDPRWGKTQGARDEVSSTVMGVLNGMGLR